MPLTGSTLIRDTLTLILAGGQGERLSPLTKLRTKPSVPFGGKYRIIDFTLSNCLNSGLRKIYVLTQYKSDSLNQHLYEAWNIFNPDLGEFIFSVPPQQKTTNDWYQGTANAIEQNINFIENYKYKRALILSGDHIYKMDYLKMLQYHEDKKADLSIGSLYVPKDQAHRFGILDIDENYQVNSFVEKPKDAPEAPDRPGYSFINMGIYIFDTKVLTDVLKKMSKENVPNSDFGKHVIPYMLKEGHKIMSFRFENEKGEKDPYWMDIGTLDSYYAASMDLITPKPEFNLYDQEWPLRTKQLQFPPAKTLSHEGERVGRAYNAMITDGSIISGGLVERSILGPNVKVNSYS
jgi:glucose-1-phosphate adenylyltransferase